MKAELAPSAEKAGDRKRAYLYLTVTVCIWGSLYVVGKAVMSRMGLPPMTLLFFRYLIGALTLTLVLRLRAPGEKPAAVEKKDRKYLLLIGGVGYFLAVGSQTYGTKLCAASTASLINSMNPVTMMLFAALLLGERMTVRKGISIVLAIVGVYIVLGGGSGDNTPLGVLCCIVAVLLWSLVSVMVRAVTQKYDPIGVTQRALIVGCALCVPAAAAELILQGGMAFHWELIPALLYLGVICTGLSFFLWNKSLSLIDAGTCSLFYPGQPLMSVLLGWLFLGEGIGLNFVIGAALIVAGVLLTVVRGKKSAT